MVMVKLVVGGIERVKPRVQARHNFSYRSRSVVGKQLLVTEAQELAAQHDSVDSEGTRRTELLSKHRPSM